jgi:undecaprenyl phosphate N,N'-diacetylbacillosamine 1-phosphate transferase
MRPGITGLTQVTVRNSVSWDDRIRIDVEYIERFNLWLDIKILAKTLMKVFLHENIYLISDKKSTVGSTKEVKL